VLPGRARGPKSLTIQAAGNKARAGWLVVRLNYPGRPLACFSGFIRACREPKNQPMEAPKRPKYPIEKDTQPSYTSLTTNYAEHNRRNGYSEKT